MLNLKPGIKIVPSLHYIFVRGWGVGGDGRLERDYVRKDEAFHFSYHLVSLPIK